MAPEKAGTKRPIEEVEDLDASVEQAIIDSVTNGTAKSQPSKKKPRVEERRSIFVRSLPTEATNETLAEFFSEYFPVKHATVITDAKTKQSKGFGFVTFADAEDAQQAKVALDKKNWQGRGIRIEIAEPRHRDEKKSGPAPAVKPGKPEIATANTKLIVRNLPWSIKTSEQLGHIFRSCGKVKFADLPNNKGKLKGFGFVTLRGRKNAEKALELINGKEIDGRQIAVDWAVDKKTWDDQQDQEEVQGKSDKADVGDDSDATSSSGSDSDDDDESDDEDEDEGREDSANEKPVDKQLDEDMKNFLRNHMENLEEESDDDENEDDEGQEDNAKANDHSKKPQSTDNSATVFIRNLPFTTTDEQLKGHFSTFGDIRYARVVFDKATDRPAGTAFVCFYNADDAKACIKGAPRPQQSAAPKAKHSILQDENADPEGKYTLDGRLLQVAQAVNRETAAHLADSSSQQRRLKDKRRLFLLQEGQITPRSPMFKLLSESELAMRGASEAQRKKMVEKNPSLHLSLTRLALRNIPRNIGSRELKELARKAVVGFAKDVKEGRREPLSKEENARDGKDAKEKEKERKAKGKGIIRQAKIVFESKEGSKVPEKSGAGKSRGYGFIEYTSHHWALMGLRYLNGHQLENDNGRKQRLIVEFAIENAQVVQRRKTVEATGARKSQEKAQEMKQEAAENERTAKILKENKAARGKKGAKKPKGNMNKGPKGKDKDITAEPQEEPAGEDGGDMKQKLIARKRLMKKKKAKARG